MDFSIFATADAWIALLTLTLLEIVLGIDNIIFISLVSDKLPEHQQKKARRLGLSLALITRILLLMSLSWLVSLQDELFSIWGKGFSGRDLVLLIGGLFLIYKATVEIHDKIDGEEDLEEIKKPKSFTGVIVQILILDVVFSLDSVITAVGMAKDLMVMVLAVVIAIIIMLIAAESVSRFVNKRPTVKMLALAFLVMIGASLIVEGWGGHVEKGYIYFAMGFSVMVEILNLRVASLKHRLNVTQKTKQRS